MWRLYKQATVVDPVDVDKPGYGKPSDHKCVLLYPIDNQTEARTAHYVLKRVRPMPESGLQSFEAAVARIDLTPLVEIQDTDLLDSKILKLLLDIRETHLPQKVVKLRSIDKTFITNELKVIDRQRKREYAKRGKSVKFHILKNRFDTLYTKVSKDFLRKNVDSLTKVKPGKAHKILKKLGAKPGEDKDSTEYEIPEFKDRGLTNEQIANCIGDFFAQISQQHNPLNILNLQPLVKAAILVYHP